MTSETTECLVQLFLDQYGHHIHSLQCFCIVGQLIGHPVENILAIAKSLDKKWSMKTIQTRWLKSSRILRSILGIVRFAIIWSRLKPYSCVVSLQSLGDQRSPQLPINFSSSQYLFFTIISPPILWSMYKSLLDKPFVVSSVPLNFLWVSNFPSLLSALYLPENSTVCFWF